jgi:signal transduction histidine kinase
MGYTYNNKPQLVTQGSIITGVNNGFVNLTGYTGNELIGKSLKEICCMLKMDLGILIENIQDCFIYYMFTKAYKPREVKVCSNISDDKRGRIFYFEEIFDSRIDEKFTFLEHLYRDNKTGVAIHSVPELILLRANQKYLEFMDAPYNKLEESIGSELKNIVTGFEGSPAEEAWLKVIETGEPCYNNEFRFDCFKRGTTYFESSIIPILIDGKVKYIIETTTDVTNEVKANKAMEETLQFQEEFFANISHELRTPINVFYSAIQMLERNMNFYKNLEHSDKIYVKMMKQNCFRLLKLVNNLIDISKIQSGQFKLILNNHNIVNIVEDITLSVIEHARSKGVDIIFDTDIEEKVIICDQNIIERIILNLISNALKFTSSGDRISVELRNKKDNLIIAVKDTGIGIPEDKQGMIFERFKQVDRSLSRASEGSGIGLALVKLLVEMLNGKISVKSKISEGSEFIVEFPVRATENIENDLRMEISYLQNDIDMINIELSDIYL